MGKTIKNENLIFISEIPNFIDIEYQELIDYLLDRNIYYIVIDIYRGEELWVELNELIYCWDKIEMIQKDFQNFLKIKNKK